MPTKEEQYNDYCKYLHTEQIRDGLIRNTGKKSGRSLYRGNLIEPYKISDVKLIVALYTVIRGFRHKTTGFRYKTTGFRY